MLTFLLHIESTQHVKLEYFLLCEQFPLFRISLGSIRTIKDKLSLYCQNPKVSYQRRSSEISAPCGLWEQKLGSLCENKLTLRGPALEQHIISQNYVNHKLTEISSQIKCFGRKTCLFTGSRRCKFFFRKLYRTRYKKRMRNVVQQTMVQ